MDLHDKNGTLACLACGKEAEQYTGHVHINGEKVTAGWCEAHADQHCNMRTHGDIAPPFNSVCKGCYGYWTVDE